MNDVLRSYARGIRTSIRYNAGAYGYSVVITASFGAVTAFDGAPSVAELFLFVAGASAAFAIIEAIASNMFRDRMTGDRPEVVVLGSAFAFVSIGGGLGSACLVGWLVDPWLSWLLAPLAATASYLLLLGIELALAHAAGGSMAKGR